MKIDSLRKSISEMNSKESYEFILELRKRRRLAPEKFKKEKKRKKGSKKELNIGALLNSLTKEQAALLLEKFGGGS